jgi:hypothetical protein
MIVLSDAIVGQIRFADADTPFSADKEKDISKTNQDKVC